MGYYYTGVLAGCSLATLPFIYGLYRLDIMTRNEALTHQLSRLVERRFSHRRVDDILKNVEEKVAERRAQRPALFKFEVPLEPGAIVDRRRTNLWDDKNAATWGIDPRINIEMYSKSLADPNQNQHGIDHVLKNVAQTRVYLKKVVAGEI